MDDYRHINQMFNRYARNYKIARATIGAVAGAGASYLGKRLYAPGYTLPASQYKKRAMANSMYVSNRSGQRPQIVKKYRKKSKAKRKKHRTSKALKRSIRAIASHADDWLPAVRARTVSATTYESTANTYALHEIQGGDTTTELNNLMKSGYFTIPTGVDPTAAVVQDVVLDVDASNFINVGNKMKYEVYNRWQFRNNTNSEAKLVVFEATCLDITTDTPAASNKAAYNNAMYRASISTLDPTVDYFTFGKMFSNKKWKFRKLESVTITPAQEYTLRHSIKYPIYNRDKLHTQDNILVTTSQYLPGYKMLIVQQMGQISHGKSFTSQKGLAYTNLDCMVLEIQKKIFSSPEVIKSSAADNTVAAFTATDPVVVNADEIQIAEEALIPPP